MLAGNQRIWLTFDAVLYGSPHGRLIAAVGFEPTTLGL